LGAYPVVAAGELRGLFAAFAGVGCALLLASVVGVPQATPWTIAVLAGEYVGSLFTREDAIDLGAPLVAAGLLLVAELASWSLDLRTPKQVDRAANERRALTVLAVSLAGLALAASALAASRMPLGGTVILLAVGVACSLGVLALIAGIVRVRQRP
jgi:hypothetical protein